MAVDVVKQERVLNFVLREGGGAEQVPKAALIQFLQHEYEVKQLTRNMMATDIYSNTCLSVCCGRGCREGACLDMLCCCCAEC